jgi:AcrR family transcriptional regulator
MRPKRRVGEEELLERCLATYIGAGTIDLSLDQLAGGVGISKRMLVHYFGGRESIERRSIGLLEKRLRAQFAPETFPRGISPRIVVTELWKRTTAVKSKGVLLLAMDVSQRAWKGSSRAKAFYVEQQRLWVRLLMKYLPDQPAVEEVLQLFQGALLAYLITGDPEPGRRSLSRMLSSKSMKRQSASPQSRSRPDDPV